MKRVIAAISAAHVAVYFSLGKWQASKILKAGRIRGYGLLAGKEAGLLLAGCC
jgi:hypothetical protein